MFHTKIITSKLHKNVLMAMAVACIAASVLLRKPIAQQMSNPMVKIFTVSVIAAMTYLSPIIGCVLAACFVYIITAFSTEGFTEGVDGEEDAEDEEDEDDKEDGTKDVMGVTDDDDDAAD